MKTLLYEKHRSLGAHFVNFGGWEMPLQYHGIREEHMAVRKRVGLFDVSHMGRIAIEGPQAELFMDEIAANKIVGKKDYSATYTVLCNASGGCVDDTIIYRINTRRYFMVANAANRQKDLAHLKERAKDFDVEITPCYDKEGIFALQGPLALDTISSLFSNVDQLKPMRFMEAEYLGCKIYISSTGYTGAGGFEIYAPLEISEIVWDQLMYHGKAYGLLPAGLGARNTLRLEMGYALYGHEIDETIAPTESVAAWSVKLDKANFFGKAALVALEQSPHKRSAHAILLKGSGVIRDNYLVFCEGREVGRITSGGYSPSLNQSIGLILTHQPLQVGNHVEVQIRKHYSEAEVVNLPFIHTAKEVR